MLRRSPQHRSWCPPKGRVEKRRLAPQMTSLYAGSAGGRGRYPPPSPVLRPSVEPLVASRGARRARRLRCVGPRGGHRSPSVALLTVDTPGRPVQSDLRANRVAYPGGGKGVRKAEETRGGRRTDPASASPKYPHLREVLLDLIESELSFHARSRPNETSMNASGCPGEPGGRSSTSGSPTSGSTGSAAKARSSAFQGCGPAEADPTHRGHAHSRARHLCFSLPRRPRRTAVAISAHSTIRATSTSVR